MAQPRRHTEAAQRAAARREREDSAPRLRNEQPKLESLSLQIDQRRVESPQPGVIHVRRVVVDTAPALFVVPCCDRECKEGGHDLTYDILAALRKGLKKFDGTNMCSGQLGTGACHSMLRYSATASYKTDA
jgi:hypothetical protein